MKQICFIFDASENSLTKFNWKILELKFGPDQNQYKTVKSRQINGENMFGGFPLQIPCKSGVVQITVKPDHHKAQLHSG